MWMLMAGGHLFAADWPRFRGPNGSGVGESAPLPVEFGPDRNAAWKAQTPFGRSSPIVAGGRVFITAAEGETLITLAYDAATGRQIWRKDLKRARATKIYKANDAASPTPAADDRSVYAFFPDFGLVSYSFDGKERWRHPLGPFDNFYGMASSPVVAGGLVIILCDQNGGSFLLALNKEDGRQRWKTQRPEATEGWGVPIIHQDQLIAVGANRVDSYHLSTGEPRWWIPIASHGSMGTPLVNGDLLIIATSGSDQPLAPAFESKAPELDKDKDGRISFEEFRAEKDWAEHFGWIDSNHDRFIDAAEWGVVRSFGVGDHGAMAIPLHGKGRLDRSVIRWRVTRGVPYVPAPVLYDGVYYMVKDGGIISSIDPASGRMHKQGRTEKAPGQYLASPVAADAKIFVVSEEGKMTVLKASPNWEILAINDFNEEIYATPAISGGRIFVRTAKALYAFEPPRRR
jgi:outer membrane protein assembly factor BamB